MNNKFIFFYLILALMTPSKAYAYLDPGTGSIILQAILGFIAAAITSISIYWTKFKSLLNKIFRKKKDNFDKNK
jgi:hypothetical protein